MRAKAALGLFLVGFVLVIFFLSTDTDSGRSQAPAPNPIDVSNSNPEVSDADEPSSTDWVVVENTKFVFSPGVSPSDQALAQQAIAHANDYFEQYGSSAGPATVSLIIDDTKSTTRGKPDEQSLTITAGTDWESFGDADQYKLFVHEYYHVLQFQLSKGKSTSEYMALWLKEGSAEYIARRLAQSNGYSIFQGFQQKASSAARASTVRLADLEGHDEETWTHYEHIYGGLSFTAIDYLVSQYGEEALFKYWVALGKSSDWRSAFQSTFGLSVEEFYRNYEGFLKS